VHGDFIACYHRVLPPEARVGVGRPYFARGTALTTEAFAAQLLALRERFEIVGEAEALRRLGGAAGRRPFCWLTFDDGYRDVLAHAAPTLRRLGLPATLYVPTAILDDPPRWLPADAWYAVLASARTRRGVLRGFDEAGWAFDLDEPSHYERLVLGAEKRKYLDAPAAERDGLLGCLARALRCEPPPTPPRGLYVDADDLARLRDDGWSVGAHAHSHALLTTLPAAEVARELARSREVLAGLGHHARTLAYPDGAWSAAVASAARDAGFEAALALGSGSFAERYAFPRTIMTGGAT
jgi:peptidoglycan/xylan/chitin deacetylase (PgdA/CDA1 family)